MATKDLPKSPYLDCPLCHEHTLADHCDNERAAVKCHWLVCQNRSCLAVLDVKAGRGHRLHPEGKTIKGTDIPLRVRVIRFGEEDWRDRDIGD